MTKTERDSSAINLGTGTDGEFHRPKDSVLYKDPLVKAWSESPVTIVKYSGGTFDNGDQIYSYKPGLRMIIEGKEVIDSSQYPYWVRAVRAGMEKVQLKRGEILKVTEAGLGLLMCANRIMNEALADFIREGKRAHYRGIELNKGVYDKALEWKEGWIDSFRKQSNGGLDVEPGIKITLYQGEAAEVAEDLGKRGRVANLIFADTFPIRDDAKGVNDLLLLPGLTKHMSPDAVLVFFSYTREADGYSTSQVEARQRELLDEAFDVYDISTEWVPVFPPPDYDFLKRADNTMITSLPLIVVSQIKVKDKYREF